MTDLDVLTEALSESFVELREVACHTDHVGHICRQPFREDLIDRRPRRKEGLEMEAAAKGAVDETDRAVGGIHGPDHQKVVRQLEGLLRAVQERYALVSVLKQEEQFTEDARQVD